MEAEGDYDDVGDDHQEHSVRLLSELEPSLCLLETGTVLSTSTRPTTPITTAAVARSTSETVASAISFDNNKAGLQSVDKAKTEAIINEVSKGSYYYINEQRKADLRHKKVQELLEKAKVYERTIASDPMQVRRVQRSVASLEESIESTRSLTRIFAHMDMDMFYAAVEQKKKPELERVPLGVGSSTMLSTTNYLARQYGVRAGMPGFIGKKLCPGLVIMPLDFPSYKEEAAKVRQIVEHYDAHYHSLGLDEVTMDLTAFIAVHHPQARTAAERYTAAEEIMRACRAQVHEVTQLTASAGIAPTPTLAKIASNVQKPNGQHTLALCTREEVMQYVGALSCRQVPGIGKSQEAILSGLGIKCMKDIYEHKCLLFHVLTTKTFEFLFSSALGVGGFFGAAAASTSTRGEADAEEVGRKSVGQECTFYKLKSRLELQSIAHNNLKEALDTLQKEALLCGMVVLKMKHKNFHVKQYSKKVNPCTDDMDTLRRVVDELLLPLVNGFADYRLLGVRLEKVVSKSNEESSSKQSTLLSFIGSKRPASGLRPSRESARVAYESRASASNTTAEVVVVTSSSSLSSDENVYTDEDDVVIVE